MNLQQLYSEQSDYIQELLQVTRDGVTYGHYDGYEFHSVFQPIYDRQNRVFGMEGLSRIKGPSGQTINPYDFFTSSEQDIRKNIVYSLLCGKVQTTNFASSAFRKLQLFMNVSPSVFNMLANNEAAIQHFVSRLHQLNLRESQIVYEIIEFEEPDLAGIIEGKNRLASYGIRTALDDYGAMHSTKKRALMIRSPFLKIDKDKISDRHFVKEAVTLAKSIRAKTIAEGIENKQEYDQCKALGVNLFQGYYLAKPNPISSFTLSEKAL